MHIHWLQHVPFEGLGIIKPWSEQNGHTLSCTRFWADEKLPEPGSIDMLIIMGGPMGVHDEALYPWLAREKEFIRQAAAAKKVILGICLGAQLLALACGGAVYPNREKEIGWFPVTRKSAVPDWVFEVLPAQSMMFHWHGDTFDVPESGVLLCSSEACINQGFVLDDRMIGLQFHPEMTSDGIGALIENCRSELKVSPWIQSEQQLHDGSRYMQPASLIMEKLLNHCAFQASRS